MSHKCYTSEQITSMLRQARGRVTAGLVQCVRSLRAWAASELRPSRCRGFGGLVNYPHWAEFCK